MWLPSFSLSTCINSLTRNSLHFFPSPFFHSMFTRLRDLVDEKASWSLLRNSFQFSFPAVSQEMDPIHSLMRFYLIKNMIMFCVECPPDIPWGSFILRHKQALAIKCDPVGTPDLVSEGAGEGWGLQEKTRVCIYVFRSNFPITPLSFSTFWFCKQRNV